MQVININLDSDIFFLSYYLKNLGILFQSDLSLDNHISSVIKSCFMQFCDFHRIRPLISKTAAITLANSFINSRLDYCNSLFYALPNNSIHCLQKVQNTAARIFRSSHITLILKSLHWLPLNYRINLRFVTSLIVLCLYLNLIILVLSSAFDQILILFVLSLLAHCYHPYFNKKSQGFRLFSYAAPHLWNHLPHNVRIASTYLHFLEKILKPIFLTKLFLLRLYPI